MNAIFITVLDEYGNRVTTQREGLTLGYHAPERWTLMRTYHVHRARPLWHWVGALLILAATFGLLLYGVR